MKKRVLCLLLSVLLCISVVPASAFASDITTYETDEKSIISTLSDQSSSSYETLQAKLNAGGTVKLETDLLMSTPLEISNTVTLDLNGLLLRTEGERMLTVKSGAVLTITDSQPTTDHNGLYYPAGGVLSGTASKTINAAIKIENGGKLILNGGTIYNCGGREDGGGVLMDSGSRFEMNGGAIQNCKGLAGAAVYVADGAVFTMAGGTIDQNQNILQSVDLDPTIFYSHGVYVASGGTFTMSGDATIGYVADESSRFKDLCNYGTMNANGGTVSGAVVNLSTITQDVKYAGTNFNGSVINRGDNTVISGGNFENSTGITLYKVTFNSMGGTAVPTQYRYNAPADIPVDPKMDDYYLESWYRDEALTNEWNFSTIITEDITLYASWLPKIRGHMTFDYNGGTDSVGDTSIELPCYYNDPLEAPTAEELGLTRTGYIFTGWAQKNGAPLPELVPDSYLTFYAQWTPISYTVQLDSNGGTPESGAESPISAVYDTGFTLPNASKAADEEYAYDFAGWKASNGTVYAAGQEVSNLTATDGAVITLTAQWTQHCIHPSSKIDANGLCSGCNTQMAALVTVNSASTYYKTFKEACDAIRGNNAYTEMELLANCGDSSETVRIEATQLCIRMNSYSVSSNIYIDIGNSFNMYVDINGAKTCLFTGNIELHGGTLKTYKCTFNNISVSDEGVLNVFDSNINNLTVSEGQVAIEEGSFDSITVSGSVTYAKLLKKGSVYNDADGNYITADSVTASAPVKVVICTHPNVSTSGSCDYCSGEFKAKIERNGSEYYYNDSFTNVYSKARSGDIITIYDNADMKARNINGTEITFNKDLTIDLNGYALNTYDTAGTAAQAVINSAVTIKNGTVTSGLKTTASSTAALTIDGNVNTGTINIEEGSSLTVKGNNVTVSSLYMPANATVNLYSGAYGFICDYDSTMIASCLGDACAFTDSDGNIINHNGLYTLSDVTVIPHTEHIYSDGKCPCGVVCHHTNTFTEDHKCTVCGMTAKASIYVKAYSNDGDYEITEYFGSIDAAVVYATDNVKWDTNSIEECKITLLEDDTLSVQSLTHTLHIDIDTNTLTLSDELIINGNVNFNGVRNNYGKINGNITVSDKNQLSLLFITLTGKVTVDGEAATLLLCPCELIAPGDTAIETGGQTVGDLICSQCAYYTEEDGWDIDYTATSLGSVSVREVPFTRNIATTGTDKDGKAYGDTVTLKAVIRRLSNYSTSVITYQWYEFDSAASQWTAIECETSDTFVSTSLNAGAHKMKCVVSGNITPVYSLSVEYDFTIDKATISESNTTFPKAKENLVYTGSPQQLIEEAVVPAGALIQYSTDAVTWHTSASEIVGTIADATCVYWKITGDNFNEYYGSAIEAKILPASYTAAVTMADFTVGSTPSVPTVDNNPENGEVKFYYNTENSNSGGTEWTADIELTEGTYYMYAVIEETQNYTEVTTEPVQFRVNAAGEAQIGDTEYDTLSDALAAAVSGDTVKLAKNVSADMITVFDGVTLDLNGKVLTATYVFAVKGANVIDSQYTGTLKVNPNNIILSTNNSMIPVYNAVDGYVFINAMAWDNATGLGVVTDDEADTLTFTFIPLLGGKAATEQNVVVPLLGDGASDNEMSVVVRLDWKTDTGTAYQDFVYTDALVANAVNNRGSYALTLTLSNYSKLKNLNIKAMIISNTGAQKSGTDFEYNK